MLSTRWILCIFPSVAKERERDAAFLFLLFIRVFILFICIFILEYICRNISDVLNIQRKCYYWISLFLPQMLKIFILTPKTEVSVLLFSFQAATHSHTTSKTFFCFSFLFFFSFCSNERPIFCSQFRWSCLHMSSRARLQVGVTNLLLWLCNGRSLFHKRLVLGFLLLKKNLFSSNGRRSSRLDKKGLYFVLYRGYTTNNSPTQSLTRTRSSTGKY